MKLSLFNFFCKIKTLPENLLKKSAKQVPKLTFKKNPFRKKGRPCSFCAKRVYSPYLFWVEYSTPSKIHLMNLILNWNSNFNLYNMNSSSNEPDVEEHNGKIYTCGGYYSTYLSTCYSLDLSNIKKSNSIQISSFPESKCNHSLLSTPLHLFALGGYNSSGSYTNTCYRLINNSWDYVPSLNFNRAYITSAFVYPYFAYIICCNQYPTIERLDIKKNDKWEKFDKIQGNTRHNGSCCYINENQILCFGGGPNKGKFYISEMKYLESDINGNCNSYYYCGSKARLFNHLYQIVSRNNSKRVYIDLKNNGMQSVQTDF